MTDFWHDRATDTLIYPRHALLTQTLDEAREINGQYVAVPRNLRNLQILRHYNFPVAPIITNENYDWPKPPHIKKPYESQKIAANFMALHPRCFNLSAMGTGKTASALWAADWLMRQYPPGSFRALIVCPLSIMQRVWSDAIFKGFLGKRQAVVLHGSATKRLELLKQDADFYIINHDGVGIGAHTRKRFDLDGLSKALAERQDIKLAIVDEASAYKDAQTRRHRIARLVLGQRNYLWLMTGSPTPQAPTDAYGLAKLVNNAFGKSFTSFRLDTMQKITNFKWAPYRDGYEKARRLLQPSIRFDLSQVWDGPEMTVQQREIELTSEQKKMLADLKRDLIVAAKSGKLVTAANEAAARTKYLQISLGAIYDADHKVHLVDASPRYNELKDLIEQASGKILVFAPLTSVIHIIYKELKNLTSCEVVYGGTSQADRSRIFQDFQSAEWPRVLIADSRTMGHGLDLFRAQTVCWFGPVDSAEIFSQANHRAYRPGQTGPVCVVQFVSTPLEREIFRRLENNLSLQGALLDLVRDEGSI
jgi:SNF2 family DNA or RNA helicase